MTNENVAEVWNSVLAILEKEISPSTFNTWILPLEPQYFDENNFVVHTGQAFAPGMLRKNHYEEIVGAIKSVVGKELEIKIIFDEELKKSWIKKAKQKKPKKNQPRPARNTTV